VAAAERHAGRRTAWQAPRGGPGRLGLPAVPVGMPRRWRCTDLRDAARAGRGCTSVRLSSAAGIELCAGPGARAARDRRRRACTTCTLTGRRHRLLRSDFRLDPPLRTQRGPRRDRRRPGDGTDRRHLLGPRAGGRGRQLLRSRAAPGATALETAAAAGAQVGARAAKLPLAACWPSSPSAPARILDEPTGQARRRRQGRRGRLRPAGALDRHPWNSSAAAATRPYSGYELVGAPCWTLVGRRRPLRPNRGQSRNFR